MKWVFLLLKNAFCGLAENDLLKMNAIMNGLHITSHCKFAVANLISVPSQPMQNGETDGLAPLQ